MQSQSGPQHVLFLQERRRFRARVCLISPPAFLQFTQERTVNFANETRRGILLLLLRCLRSKPNGRGCVIPDTRYLQALTRAVRTRRKLVSRFLRISLQRETMSRCRKCITHSRAKRPGIPPISGRSVSMSDRRPAAAHGPHQPDMPSKIEIYARRLSRNTACWPNRFQNHHGAFSRSGVPHALSATARSIFTPTVLQSERKSLIVQ